MSKHYKIEREVDCDECGGSGRLYENNGPAPRSFSCSWCAGTGTVPAPVDDDDYSDLVWDGYVPLSNQIGDPFKASLS